MTQPSDHRCLGTLLDRNPFGAGDRAAADRGGMVGHGNGEPLSKIGMVRVKCQEGDHGPVEVLDVLGLNLLTAFGVGFFSFSEAFCGSLSFEIGTNLIEVDAEVQMPREKTFRPFFSATTQ